MLTKEHLIKFVQLKVKVLALLNIQKKKIKHLLTHLIKVQLERLFCLF